ncbi:hypothetical protein Tco_0650268 [Tanacetum coccineum]
MEDDVDINTLTLEQYIAWVQNDIRPGVVKPTIENDIEFKINSNFMRELRRKIFKGTDDEDAHEHVRRVLEIADLFHFPGVTHDAFIRRYCPPFKTAKKLEIIRNFKQEMDETLYHAWERMLDSREFIPLMTPTQALKSIQIMAEHSHDWYDETTTRERINDRPDNIDAIQASSKEAHLTKECPLKKDKEVEQSKYVGSLEETIIKFCEESIKKQAAEDEWIRKFIENTDSNVRALKTTTKNLQEKAYQLTQTVLTNTSEKDKTRTTKGKENVKEPVPRDLPVVQTYVPPTSFLGHLKGKMGDMDVGWDITIKDVERLRKFLTPTIHTPLGPVHDKEKIVMEEEYDYDIPLHDGVMQPLTSQTVHIIPPDNDYVASATNPILNKQLNEFREE